jgi:hypothetical protein
LISRRGLRRVDKREEKFFGGIAGSGAGNETGFESGTSLATSEEERRSTGAMLISGMIAGFLILGLFFAMISSSPKEHR